LLPYLGFSVIFFPIIFLIVRLGWLLRRTIRYTVFGSFDSLAGAAVGLFTWAFGASVFLWMIMAIGVKIPESTTKNAILMPLIKPLAPKIIGKATEEWIPKGAEKLRAIKDGR
jgi:membrane protein required for colicin V production